MSYDCPICGQYMDFIATTYRNHPFIDGKCYKKMCFTCAHVPMERVENEDGIERVFSHKHLHSAEDLYSLGSAQTLEQAERSLRGVRRRINEVGIRQLNKLRLTRPEPEYDFNDEFEEKLRKQWAKKKRKSV